MASATYTQRLNSTANNVLTVALTETTNVANNTSKIDYSVYVVGGGYSVTNNNKMQLYLGGNKIFDGNPGKVTDSTPMATGSWTFTHDANGGGSFAVYCYYETMLLSDGIVSATINATHTSTSIPRASTISVSNGTLNTSQTITITRASSSFTHTLTYKCGSATGTIATKTTSTSVSWKPDLSLAAQDKNHTSLSCTVTCDTYSGNSKIGSSSKTISLAIPASVAPTAGNITASEGNTAQVPANPFSGIYVQGKSKLKLTCVASTSADQGATISSAIFKIGSSSYTATITHSGTNWTCVATGGFLNASGTVNYSFTATDSRGRTVTKTGSVTVTAYSAPTVSFSVVRCNASGTAQNDGSYAKVEATNSYASLNNKNTYSCTLEYKVNPSTTGTTKTYSTTSVSDVISGIGTDNTYVFTMTVTDKFGSVSATKELSTAFCLMDFLSDGTGIAMGKVAAYSETLDINLITRFRKTVELELPDGVGIGNGIFYNNCGSHDKRMYLGGQGYSGGGFELYDQTDNQIVYSYGGDNELWVHTPLYCPSPRGDGDGFGRYNVGARLDELSWVHNVQPNKNTEGWISFGYIQISGAYYDQPITFHITQRQGRSGTLSITFGGGNSTDPGLSSLVQTGTLFDCKVSKTATSTWRLWIYATAWDQIDITRVDYPKWSRQVAKITYDSQFSEGEPEGTKAIRRFYQNAQNMWWGTLTSGSITLPGVYTKQPSITVIAQPGSGSSYVTMIIPISFLLDGTDRQFAITNESQYVTFKIKRSAHNVVLTYVGSNASGAIKEIY